MYGSSNLTWWTDAPTCSPTSGVSSDPVSEAEVQVKSQRATAPVGFILYSFKDFAVNKMNRIPGATQLWCLAVEWLVCYSQLLFFSFTSPGPLCSPTLFTLSSYCAVPRVLSQWVCVHSSKILVGL